MIKMAIQNALARTDVAGLGSSDAMNSERIFPFLGRKKDRSQAMSFSSSGLGLVPGFEDGAAE